MKNKIIILFSLLCIGIFFSGCSSSFEESSSIETRNTEKLEKVKINTEEYKNVKEKKEIKKEELKFWETVIPFSSLKDDVKYFFEEKFFTKYIAPHFKRTLKESKNISPMDAYVAMTGVGYYNTEWWCLELMPDFLQKKHPLGVKMCAVSPDEKNYAFRVENHKKDSNKSVFNVVTSNNDHKMEYDSIDQLVYSPDSKELVYRALKDGKWYVIKNETESKAYKYAHTFFYLENGNFYSLVENEKNKWDILLNGKAYLTYDYIDSLLYIDKANDFLFRAKSVDNSGNEKWFISSSKEKLKEWSYVDNLYYIKEFGTFYYRARNEKGEWFLVRVSRRDNKILETVLTETEEMIMSAVDEKNIYKDENCEEELEGEFDYGYIVFPYCIYWDKKLLKNIHRESFKKISPPSSFAKDKDNIYRYGVALDEVDLDSFVLMDNNYYKDKNYVYLYNKKMENSDPDTFKVLSGGYFKDKNNVYFKETIIKNADPETFIADGMWLGRDKNNNYYRDSVKAVEKNMNNWNVYSDDKYKFEIKHPTEGWNFKKYNSYDRIFGLSRDVGYDEDDANILVYVYEGNVLNNPDYYLNKTKKDVLEENIIINDYIIKKVSWNKSMVMLYLYREDINTTIVFSGYFGEKEIIDLMLLTLSFE